MKELNLIKEKTCCFSGHRVVENNFDFGLLNTLINDQIEKGIDTFLCGMALGFDTISFNVLEKIRQTKKIKIIACIPCAKQTYKFNEEQRKEYDRMLKSADDTIYISSDYTKYCMIKRNMYMVDNSCVLICYIRENIGGTYNTLKYAERQKLEIVKL